MYLEKINSPADIKSYSVDELKKLAQEIRDIEKRLYENNFRKAFYYAFSLFLFSTICSCTLSASSP